MKPSSSVGLCAERPRKFLSRVVQSMLQSVFSGGCRSTYKITVLLSSGENARKTGWEIGWRTLSCSSSCTIKERVG